MLKRLFIVIASILAFIFIPYYTGVLITYLIGWEGAIIWLTGAVFDILAFGFLYFLHSIIMYIIEG